MISTLRAYKIWGIIHMSYRSDFPLDLLFNYLDGYWWEESGDGLDSLRSSISHYSMTLFANPSLCRCTYTNASLATSLNY